MKILKSITLAAILFVAVGVNAQSSRDKKVIKDAENAKEKLMTMGWLRPVL